MQTKEQYIGRVIGNFRIDSEIGRGANGVVYKARQLSLDRDVALKILFEDKASQRDYVDRFFREAREGAKLSSEYIVKIYDLGVADGNICYFAMELVEGENAEQYLFQLKHLPERTVLEIARAVATGLYYAYEKCRFVHGDLKPANLLIRKRDGAIKLADLGLAQREDEKRFAEIMATPAYTAPELAVGENEKFGCKTDLYSYGVMLYELLTGSVPYRGKDTDEVLHKHLEAPIPDVCAAMPGIDPGWSALIHSLLAKRPEDRPENWSEVIDWLDSFAAGMRPLRRSELH